MATNAEIFHFLLNQQRDAAGILESGSAEFYEAGTSNFQAVWTDREKNTLSANPATLAQDGTVAVYGDGTYRVVIKDADGVVVHDYPAIEMGFVSNNLATIVSDCEAAQTAAEAAQTAAEEAQAAAEEAQAAAEASYAATLFESAAQTITKSSALVVAHGLGAEPRTVDIVLECTSGELGYSIGDRLLISNSAESNVGIKIDATNVTVLFNKLDIRVNENTGDYDDLEITSTKWELYVRAAL